MKPLLLAMLALVSVQRSTEDGTIKLRFDGPVVFSQTVSIAPPQVTLHIPDAWVGAEGLDEAEKAGLLVVTTTRPGGLSITVPLTTANAATVSSSGREINVSLEAGRLMVAAIAEPAQAPAQGGIVLPPDTVPVSDGDYLIGPEDLIEVNVFELPELKTTTRVLGDGTVSLPLLGVVQAAGLTNTGFEARLRDLLAERYLLDPQVSVRISEFRSKQVSVIGAVNKPGIYQMIGPRTVLQVISEAGGLTKEAGTKILILRKTESGGAERLVLDLEDLVVRGNPELNLSLAPGDVVNIPIDQPIFVFVDGAVNKPGQVESTVSRPITLLQAIARGGGLTERANLKGVHILRKLPDGTQVRLPVNLRDIRKGKADDMLLQDGDVVVVPETFF